MGRNEDFQPKCSLLIKPTTSFRMISIFCVASICQTSYSAPCIPLLGPMLIWKPFSLLPSPAKRRFSYAPSCEQELTHVGPQTCIVVLYGSMAATPSYIWQPSLGSGNPESCFEHSVCSQSTVHLNLLPDFSNTKICTLCPSRSLFLVVVFSFVCFVCVCGFFLCVFFLSKWLHRLRHK